MNNNINKNLLSASENKTVTNNVEQAHKNKVEETLRPDRGVDNYIKNTSNISQTLSGGNTKLNTNNNAPPSGCQDGKSEAENKSKLSANMQLQVDKLNKQLSPDAPKKPEKKVIVRKDASELIVISRMRDLLKYVINATRKVPKSERYSFATKIQALAISAMENMVRANFIMVRPGKIAQYTKRYEFQEKAMGDLKVLEYLVAVAVEEEFMLLKQFKQIAKQGTEVSILLAKWMESDKRRFLANN